MTLHVAPDDVALAGQAQSDTRNKNKTGRRNREGYTYLNDACAKLDANGVGAVGHDCKGRGCGCRVSAGT